MELHDRRLAYRLRLISYVSSLTLITGSILVLTGWILNLQILTGIHPDFVSTKFNTALAFLFLGGSLLALHLNKLPSGKRLSEILAGLVLTISFLTIIQYLFNADFLIDELFVNDLAGAVVTSSPGRMAPLTATGLFIASIAMLMLNSGKWSTVYLAQALSLALVLFYFIPLLGYIYARPQFYGFPGSTGIALPTAILFLAAGPGILFALPRSGIVSLLTEKGIAGFITRKFIPVSLILPVLIILLLLLLEVTGAVHLLSDILLVSLLMITGSLFFILWFLRSLQIIETSRSRALDRAYITSEQIRLHIENTPLAVIEWDNDFRVRKWSRQAREMFGWRQDEVYNKRPEEWKFVHESNREQVERVMRKLGNGQETSAVLAGLNYTKTGAIVHCVWYNSVVHSRDGEMVSVLSLIDNVTKQKKTERKLAEREEQYRSLVEISQDAILINQDNRIMFVNAAACKLFGAVKPAQIVGRPSIELFHKDYHEIIRERIKNLVDGISVPVIEEKIVRLDGRCC
jgi:PAS domain S-box-containing protein